MVRKEAITFWLDLRPTDRRKCKPGTENMAKNQRLWNCSTQELIYCYCFAKWTVWQITLRLLSLTESHRSWPSSKTFLCVVDSGKYRVTLCQRTENGYLWSTPPQKRGLNHSPTSKAQGLHQRGSNKTVKVRGQRGTTLPELWIHSMCPLECGLPKTCTRSSKSTWVQHGGGGSS